MDSHAARVKNLILIELLAMLTVLYVLFDPMILA